MNECVSSVDTIQQEQTSQHSQLQADISGVKQHLNTDANNITQWSEQHQQQLDQRQQQVTSFINEEIKRDMPTGL